MPPVASRKPVEPHDGVDAPGFLYSQKEGSAKRWQSRTPAMAAGLTDHVWARREVLLYRVPPWPQPQGL
jgi:hypothetical protein